MPRMLIALLAAIALVATACGRGTPDTGTGPEPSSEPLPSAGSSLPVGLHELAGLEGALVRASGEPFGGASIRHADPEMTVEAIEALDENGSAER